MNNHGYRENTSIMVLNMNLGSSKDKDAVKTEFAKIDAILKDVVGAIDDDTVLMITGSKAFDITKVKKLKGNLFFSRFYGQ